MTHVLAVQRLLACALLAAFFGCLGGCPGDLPVSPGTNVVTPRFVDATVVGVLTEDQAGTIDLSATVTSASSSIASVVADLSEVGGSSQQFLTQASAGFWTYTGPVMPSQAGQCTVTFTATDADSVTASVDAQINVAFSGDNTHPVSPYVTKIPLGQAARVSSPAIGKVYVPTRNGGQLTISGATIQLIYTDGSDLPAGSIDQVVNLTGPVVAAGSPCSYVVPIGKQGWYFIRLVSSSSATLSSSFVEVGEASYRPWNGWWWAWNSSGGPTLHDAGGPLDKYDHVNGTKARSWSASNETGGDWWWGHCWGWAIASILLPEPKAVTKAGVYFTADDMKGLYSNVADDKPYIDQSLSISDIPAAAPTSKTGEAIDKYCDELYRILRICIREDHVPVLSDMRANATPPSRSNEVWNQAIYKYNATFQEAPGTGDEHVIRIDMQVWSNYDLNPPPTNNTNDRTEEYVFQLQFGDDGWLIPNSPKQNWISASHYPPRDLNRVTGSPWAPGNPYVTKARIDKLYQP